MNYTICDHTHLEHELARANAIAKEGGVSLTMVNAALLQFDHKDVVRVRGALYSENGAPYESVAEVILIQHEGLVVGEVSVLTREEALSSPDVPTMSHVDAMWPRLVDHLREIAFHLSPREMSNDDAATQAPSHEDGPPKSAHAVRIIQRLEELRQDIRDRRRRGASVAPPDDLTLTRDSQTVTSHSDGACATLPRSEETGQTTRTQRRLEELRADIRVRNELIRAFDSGVVSNYVRAVIDAGAMVAAETLTTYLCSSSIGQEALRTTSAHLINPEILNDVPGAELFVARMYFQLADPTLETTDDGKTVLIRALLPFTETKDLCEIHPLSFRGPEVRLLAEGVPVLPRPLEWAKAAIAFEDEDLFELVRPQLSADDLFVLWKEVAGYTTTEVAFLIGRNVLLGAADQKRCVFDLLPSVGQNQSEIAALLAAAWSDVPATYEITPAREPHALWHGLTIKTLLESGATMDRKNWMVIFRWDSPRTWTTQITGLKTSRTVHDWNAPAASGMVFLEEILCQLSPVEQEKRRLILETLLTSGADPRPALSSSEPLNLSPSERQLLQDVAHGWRVKSSTTTPSQSMTTDIELA